MLFVHISQTEKTFRKGVDGSQKAAYRMAQHKDDGRRPDDLQSRTGGKGIGGSDKVTVKHPRDRIQRMSNFSQ